MSGVKADIHSAMHNFMFVCLFKRCLWLQLAKTLACAVKLFFVSICDHIQMYLPPRVLLPFFPPLLFSRSLFLSFPVVFLLPTLGRSVFPFIKTNGKLGTI